MKTYILIALALASLSGCATSNYTVGREFPAERVQEIQKGETTAERMVEIFGQPFSKSAISTNQEKWVYSYVEASATASIGAVKSSSNQKTLDVLIEDGVVANFTYTEGPVSGYSTN